MGLALGSKIPLSLQLVDGRTDRFPRAWVYNASRTLLAGPLDLVHNALGEYKASVDVNMPSTPYVITQYATYTDSGHTTEDTLNGRATDIFELDEGGSGGSGPMGTCAELTAELETDQIEASIDTREIEAQIENVEFSSC